MNHLYKHFVSIIIFSCAFTLLGNAQGVGVNSSGNPADASAILDASATNKGMLMPRLTTAQMNAIPSPAIGLMIFNTDCNTINFYNGASWIAVGNGSAIATPGTITGNSTPCQNATGVNYSIAPVTGATGYNWTVPVGSSIVNGQGTTSISVNFAATAGNICVTASSPCGTSIANCIAISFTTTPAAPTSPTASSITSTSFSANWSASAGATSYIIDVATDNGFSSFVSAFNNFNVGNVITYPVSGLVCNTNYHFRVRASNGCGTSTNSTVVSLTTSACGNVWAQKASFGGTAREGAVGFSIGTKGYIGTGWAGSYTQDFWEWDQTGNTWTQKANFGGGNRGFAVGFSIGTKGYIGTGDNGTSGTKDFWEWDQAGNAWTRKTDLPGNARYGACGFSIGTKGYIGAGWDGTAFKQDFYEYDQSAGTWTTKASFTGSGRANAVGFSIGTKGYFGTGYDNLYKQDFYEWDQTGNTWTRKTDFPGAGRERAGGFAIGTKGYIGTGSIPGYAQDFYEWNQATNTWLQRANYGGSAREKPAGFTIGTKGYLGTGYAASGTVGDFWEFTP